MNKRPFIFTADANTAKQLKDLGYELVSEDSSGYTFLNCKNLDDNIPNCTFDKMKITFTNKLCI